MIKILKNKVQSRLHNSYKKQEAKNHALLYFFLEITRKCNLACIHCGSDCKADFQSAELTTESWYKIIDYISEKYSKELAFIISGGEPTIHPDLVKIVNRIKKNGNRWGMVTNGMNLSEKLLNQLIKEDLYSITISLDGLAKSHNRLRNSNVSFKKVMNSLDLIGKSTIDFKDAVTCVFPDNLHELNEVAEILIDKGIKSWRLFRIFPSGRASDNTNTQLTFEQSLQMLDWIKNNKKKYAERNLNLNFSCEAWIPFDIDKQVRDSPFFCRSGINIASILADGSITGCSNNHETFYRGNILKDSLSHVWENNFDDFRYRKWIKNTVCNNCEHVKSCEGGSIHLWNLNEDKPKFCYVKKI